MRFITITPSFLFATSSAYVNPRGTVTSSPYPTSLRSALADHLDLSTLPTPPGHKPGTFRNLRDSISYIINPERFIANRSEIFGPVFLTNIFFKPTVVIGGQVAVKDFIEKEFKGKIIQSSLPDTFSELHTEYGALNLDSTGNEHKHLRKFFNKVLSPDSVETFMKDIDSEIDAYMIELKQRVAKDPDLKVYLTPELSKFCLNIFARIFSGASLTDDQVDDFVAYNNGLLSLSKNSRSWRLAYEALNRLKKEMSSRHNQSQEVSTKDNNETDKIVNEAYAFLLQNYPREKQSEAVGMSKTLMIWGAYIECASLMIKSLDVFEKLDETERSQMISNIIDESNSPQNKGLLARGVVRESLRLNPPAGGGFRVSDVDVEVAGFRIPAGTVVSADPRIGNLDNSLFPNASRTSPERWIPKDSSLPTLESSCPLKGTALNKGAGSWFPGGIGAHQCPGVPFSEAIAASFLIKFLQSFDKWEKVSGVNSKGDTKYNLMPIKIPVDEFAISVHPRSGL